MSTRRKIHDFGGLSSLPEYDGLDKTEVLFNSTTEIA